MEKDEIEKQGQNIDGPSSETLITYQLALVCVISFDYEQKTFEISYFP